MHPVKRASSKDLKISKCILKHMVNILGYKKHDLKDELLDDPELIELSEVEGLNPRLLKGWERRGLVETMSERMEEKDRSGFTLYDEDVEATYLTEKGGLLIVNLLGLEDNLGKLASATPSKESVIDAINKFKKLYEDGFLEKKVYGTIIRRLQDILSEDPSVPKVGDIMYSSWGYSMTIVDFYKVIKVSPSGKSVTLQEMQLDVVEGTPGYEGFAMPSNYEDKRQKPIKNKRVSPSPEGYSVKINSAAWAYKWDGKKKYFNRMD